MPIFENVLSLCGCVCVCVWNLEKPFGVDTFATRSCVGESSRITSSITCLELEKDTGRMVLVTMVVASLAALLDSSLSGMSE